MAKFKPVRAKAKAPAKPGLIPCLILLISGMLLLILLFYSTLKST